MQRFFYVYLLTNRHHTVLYTGVTNDLLRRVWEHREGVVPGFTRRYNVHHLVYYEAYTEVWQAIEREKQIKAGSRQKKLALIEAQNPTWRDLYASLLPDGEPPVSDEETT